MKQFKDTQLKAKLHKIRSRFGLRDEQLMLICQFKTLASFTATMRDGEDHLLGMDVLTRIHQLSVLAGEVSSALAYMILFDVDNQGLVLCEALTQEPIDRDQILALSASAAADLSQPVEA